MTPGEIDEKLARATDAELTLLIQTRHSMPLPTKAGELMLKLGFLSPVASEEGGPMSFHMPKDLRDRLDELAAAGPK